jgi:hypothetical protein
MTEDIVNRLENRLFWSDAEEAINEIKSMRESVDTWRKVAQDWQHVSEMLAIDLGNVELAFEIYGDVKDGLYDKVRDRMIKIKDDNA